MTNAVGYARRFIDFQESVLVRLCDSPLTIRPRGEEYSLRANRPDLLNCSSRLQSCSFDALPTILTILLHCFRVEYYCPADSEFNFFPRVPTSFGTVVKLAINVKKKNLAERENITTL